jgi:hypothetical protein
MLSINVTLMCVRINILTVDKQVLHILCVCVSLVILHAKHMRRTSIYDLSATTSFFHVIS